MRFSINKSFKRAFSFVLAFVMLIGTLFVASGFETKAITNSIDQWDGSFDTSLAGSGTDNDPYLITNAEELAAVCYGKATGSKSGAYFKVSGVKEFYLDTASSVDTVKGLSTTTAIYNYYKNITTAPASWAPETSVKLNFDGNGATIYGMYINGSSKCPGLFAIVNGGSLIKNIAIKNSYIYSTNTSGGGDPYGGFIFGNGNWSSSETITIKNCVVNNNYCYSVGGLCGEIVGHAADTKIVIDSCLVADNEMYYNASYLKLPYQYFVRTTNNNSKDTVINCIGIDVVPQAREGSLANYNNNYYYGSVHHSSMDITRGVTTLTSADLAKGLSASQNLPNLNWANDLQNGDGYWHAVIGGYPSPFMPEGWEHIVLKPIWNGTAAASFAGGNGTENNPYIIETAEQLYKMVRDGGKQSNGTAAYYKVANGVTDLYLNDVQVGDLNSLKSLVSSGAAKNWTKDFNGNTYKEDLNGDGLCDEKAAFTGVFDGNGVTIHGLYSTNKGVTGIGWAIWAVGFVPSIKYDAVIKNVTFDKSYIENTSVAYSGVITCSFGLDKSNGLKDENKNLIAHGNAEDTTNATISNVVVRNTYQPASEGNSDNGGGWCKAGFIGTHSAPKTITFVNCVYDGVGSEMLIRSDAADHRAGIFMLCGGNAKNATLTNCVSIGIQPVATSVSKSYANFVNCYTTDDTFTDNNKDDNVFKITEYDSRDDLPLLNWGVWDIVTVENGRKIPVPGVSNGTISGYAAVKDMVLEQACGAGLFSYNGAYVKGEYGHFDKLVGSGTAEDPYQISTPTQLATAIATGGVNVNQKLYYKLTNDINLSSLAWIDTETVTRENEGFDEYRYKAFQGVLDGDGYTIYELNATAEKSGALIPVLDGGTVKNLHIRNSAAKSAIFAKGTGTVENCSAVNCYVLDNEDALVAGNITVKNSNINNKYYLADGTIGTPTLDGVTWYGIAGQTPRLVNNAKTMVCADIDADGVGDYYSATDLAALKNTLLKKSDYKFTYADVNKDGKVNISDLAILVRSLTDDYNHVKDGFWRNIELGNFEIYYGENDNYDAARKLELYLEAAVPGLDINKVVSANNTVSGSDSNKNAVYVHSNDTVGTPNGTLEIIVGNISNYASYTQNATGSNGYAITYDKENGVLWLQGDNFTAVEQAVLDFINNSDYKTSTVYTVENAVLSSDKQPVTINGVTYYYTWGDEFNGDELNEDNWVYNQMGSETAYENGTHLGKYTNLEHAFNKDLSKLYVVNGGKLTIKRGAYVDSDAALDIVKLDAPNLNGAEYVTNEMGNRIDSGDIYVSAGDIISEKALLVKQGYFEFKASLPSDGHAFMSWWMMGVPSGGNNNAYSESLYGKVYKLNPNYDGVNAFDGSKFSTRYKYQLPNAYFEIDIIELMQDITMLGSRYQTRLTGVYDYNLTTNIHKYYDTYTSGNNCYVVDWNTGTSKQYSLSDIDSGSEQDWIVSSRANDYIFGSNTTDRSYVENSHNKLTQMRRYGFEWTVTGNSYSFVLYIFDPDGDGQNTDEYYREQLNGFTYNEGSGPVDDIDVANQYMHFIIDNIYYAANQKKLDSNRKPTNFIDLLTKQNNDKTTLEIDYLRVYQQDGKRDIVTPETESFNNGNHFGY